MNLFSKKKVLFIAPSIMGLYKDVIEELERQNYEVSFVMDKPFASGRYDDPLRVNKDWAHLYSWKKKIDNNIVFWDDFFKNKCESTYFDYLFVIDGFCVSDYLISLLKKSNANIKTILYLWDSVQHVFKFDKNFHLFDRVYSFDIKDVDRFQLKLLPIYWVPSQETSIQYDVFGFAGFGNGFQRYNVYKQIYDFAKKEGLNSYIKLFHEEVNRNSIKNRLRKILNRDSFLQVPDDELISHTSLKTIEFRNYIKSSRIILDALSNIQSGMTTRFSWAIGAGKKIITNNQFVRDYDFYDPEQIFIYQNEMIIPKQFFFEDYEMKETIRKQVDKFRIDNWISEMFG